MPKTYDVIVIGTGTAGQTAAFELKANDLQVAMVEQSDRPGGTCALSGCQAKKWFYEGAETVARTRHMSGIGIQAPASADWSALRDAKNKFTARVPDRTRSALAEAGIDFIAGSARFADRHTIDVGHRQIAARFIVIATGAVPRPLSIDGSGRVITSSDFMELQHLPRRITFIGGGFISYEFAHFAVRLGPAKTRCTILEASPRTLAPFDQQMVDLLTQASAPLGIDVHCNVAITGVKKVDRTFVVETEDGQRHASDLVVHGAGRVADIQNLALDRAGIAYTQRGITVDTQMATTNPSVYAIGDCAATIQLARVADAEAYVAAANILSETKGETPRQTMNYSAVPALLFTYPQYGMVGDTEDSLQEKGSSYSKSFGEALAWPTYKRIGMPSAAFKLLADDAGKLLGAHILSDSAAGAINSLAMAITNNIAVSDLYRQSILTPYPSRESDLLYMLKPLIK